MPRSLSSRESENQRQVVVLIDPSDSWGRSVIRGIFAAVNQRHRWNLLIAPRDDEWRLRVPRRWKGDGIIAAIRDPKTAEHVRSLQLPTVNVSSWTTSGASWHWVSTDDDRRAKMAFAHFRERYFSHFAYYGPPSQRYPDRRGECFRKVVNEAGFQCEMFTMPSSRRGWSIVNQQTLDWLKKTPRPLAVFAADPHPAIQLAEICRGAGIQIPDEIAILAGDTDDLLCEVSDPPLSSIVLASEQIGEESVRVLDKLMLNKRVSADSIFIPPISIINRLSTDTLVVEDPHFVEALRFIRKHAESGIKVDDILQVVPVSRRLLEQRFQRYLKCSPADEIRRVRLERVKELLVSTGNSLEQIAEATGFRASSHLCFAFRKATGQTAREYRQQFRADAESE